MSLSLLLILFINKNLIDLNYASSFDLVLNIDGRDDYFYFVEIKSSTNSYLSPSITILDDGENPTIINSSYGFSIYTYRTESNDISFNIATVIHSIPTKSNLLFATIQLNNGSIYEIIQSQSTTKNRSKRSGNNDYIVKHNGSILEQAFVSIQWFHNRKRRATKKFHTTSTAKLKTNSRVSVSKKILSTTHSSRISSKNISKQKHKQSQSIPKKNRHLYLEIIAVIDSLILHDVRTLLNKTELETIEILKLYYIHIFIGVEQLYQQSLIHATFDIHIRLSKIIFSTDKHRLPWELYKNISSLTNSYRKSHHNMNLRPNISMNILRSLHQAYKSNNFDRRFFTTTADHIMTFTRLDLIDGAGLAYVLGLCLPLYKYSIIQEDLNSFSVMLTVTHELGHNLGLNHDETENECHDPHIQYIMSPKSIQTVTRPRVAYFSSCSIKQLRFFINKTTTKCWKNKIISTSHDKTVETQRKIIFGRLGQIINLRQQCQLQYGLQAIPFISVTFNKTQTLYEENICKQLKCFKKPYENFMHWQDGAYDGTTCGQNRVCKKKQCVPTNQKIKQHNLGICPYGDLFVPTSMLNLNDQLLQGNILCSEALTLLRLHGMNVTYLCYDSIYPYKRLCCEECKKHSIPECGDLNSKCFGFAQYCQMKLVRVNGRFVTELCPYTCGLCPKLPISTSVVASIKNRTKTALTLISTSKKGKPRQYIKPKQFTKHTCIDLADCDQLIASYSKLNKNVKNWCTEYSTMINSHYFVEMCPKYCSLCNITSECDRYKLCRNNGKCIRNEYGTYQCICSPSKRFYGTLCEYRRTCLDKPCSSKHEYCIQTQGEDYVCLSKQNKEQLHIILNSTYGTDSKKVPNKKNP